jgi:hypothetical protein
MYMYRTYNPSSSSAHLQEGEKISSSVRRNLLAFLRPIQSVLQKQKQKSSFAFVFEKYRSNRDPKNAKNTFCKSAFLQIAKQARGFARLQN